MSASSSRPSPPDEHADETPESAVLSDKEFHARAHEVLAAIEATLDRWLQEDEIDIDSQRTGGLLELQFPSGSKIVVNTQPPLHELWLAARTGGYHFRLVNGEWIDSRSGGEFFAMLSREISAQAGRTLAITCSPSGSSA
jgi:iron-sulfur cluster assembly protein CyaY